MRGGADGDILSVHANKTISEPNKCIIIKKKRLGFRDDLYLFFRKDMTLDDIQKFVRDAMGLADDVSFTPKFVPRTTDDTKYKLNDLFIKLSGTISYSTIESGYLQRDKQSKYKEVVTSTKHKIMLQSSAAPEIKKWEDVMSKLGFEVYNYMFDWLEVTSHTAEDGYYITTHYQKSKQEAQKSKSDSDCRISTNNSINMNVRGNIMNVKKKIDNWLPTIEQITSENKTYHHMTKEANSTATKQHLDTFKGATGDYKTSAEKYDSDVRDLRTQLSTIKNDSDYKALPQQCKELYESQFTKYRTIDEIVGDLYHGNS
jgi:hypothetical protein